MTERLFQRQMEQRAGEVIAGIFPRKQIVLDCTPGGGKTGAGTLLANRLLDAGTVDSVLWVVPRISLAEQVVDAFACGFGARQGRCLQVADGQDNLFAPNLPNMPHAVGHVTTYQAIATKRNYERFRDAVLGRRTLIIMDEVQFLNDDNARGWYPKVRQVFDAAAFRLVMSGTLWRTDDKPIPFVTYERRPDKPPSKRFPVCDIVYTLRDAVEERAVLPLEWQNRGGLVEYTYNGEEHSCDLLDDLGEEESRSIRTFLSGEKAVSSVLDSMVEDWRDWTRRVYVSRMLVMAEDTAAARRYQVHLAARHNIACVLATSREEAAGRKLRHFRERKTGQCLITVAMAYVGFDCPDLTHLAYLSLARAPSWMLQSFARVSRFDSRAPVDYDHQHAFVFGPDDGPFRRFLEWVRHQQAMGLRFRQARGPAKAPEPAPAMPDDFEPIDATPGPRAIESLYRRLDPQTAARLDAFVGRCPAASDLPRSKLYEILAAGGVDLSRFSPAREATL
jgi:superfamily II DNA or RNA helicase